MNTEICVAEAFKRPSAFLPILMSLIAIVVIVVHIAISGTAPQSDEGTAAHLWQLLMAAQVPIVAFFLIRWAPHKRRAPHYQSSRCEYPRGTCGICTCLLPQVVKRPNKAPEPQRTGYRFK
jgi:hypothetical protein